MSPWSLIFCSCHFPKLLSEITRNPLVTALGGVCSRSHPHVSLQHFAPLPLPPTNILAFPSFPLSSHSDNIFYFSSSVLLCLFWIFQGFILSIFPLFHSVPPTPSDFSLVISENLLSLSSPAPSRAPILHIVCTDHKYFYSDVQACTPWTPCVQNETSLTKAPSVPLLCHSGILPIY